MFTTTDMNYEMSMTNGQRLRREAAQVRLLRQVNNGSKSKRTLQSLLHSLSASLFTLHKAEQR